MASIYVKDPDALPERRPNDHYPTAHIDVERGLDFLWDTIAAQGHLPPGVNAHWRPCALDPGAGAGVWGAALKARCPEARIVGAELRDVRRPEAYDEWAVGNFLGSLGPLANYRFDLVIGNPPYRDGEAFCRRSLDLLKDGGYLLFLLRLTFLESQKRSTGLFVEHPPLRIGVCGRRPSFSGNGKTSPDAYCYVIWRKGFSGEPTLTWV